MVSSTEGSPTKTGWKRRSSAGSFSMYLRYSFSVVAPIARSSPRARAGFSMFEASIEPSAAPAPTRVCSSSMKRMIWPFGFGDFLQQRFQAVFEFAAIFRAGDQGGKIERHDALGLQNFGNVAGDDALREAFDDGRFAHARLADQHGIVLRAARENLHHAANFFVAADHWIELAAARQLGEIARVLFESAVALLRDFATSRGGCRGSRPSPAEWRRGSRHA